MRAVTIVEGNLEIRESTDPAPGPGDVVVEVHAAGINAADLMQRSGFYPAPEGSPADIPGLEVAGVVTQLGDGVASDLLGQRVCAIVGGGGQASHCVVPGEHLIKIPDSVSWEQAGGFAEAFCTAHDALVSQGQLHAGDRVLISGASGGVGSAAVQIAKALGAHVIAVTRNTEHHERLRALGANEVVLIDEVHSLAPVDVVLELVGAAHLSQAQHVLAPRARVVVIGVSGGGATLELNLLNVMRTRATITGSTLRARTRDEKAEVVRLVNQALLPLWSTGAFDIPVAQTFPLERASDAYDYFAEPGKFGKVMLLAE